MQPVSYATIDSPVGPLLLTGTPLGLQRLAFAGGTLRVTGRLDPPPAIDPAWLPDAGVLSQVRVELDEYFAGTRRAFSVPLAPTGTPFQRRVWQALTDIPYGDTINYGELARRLGDPNAARAVGLANGANPIAIIVPCHRVIGASGALIGFGGGLPIKRALLDLEQGHQRLL